MRIRYFIGSLLVVVTLAIFWQIRNHGFLEPPSLILAAPLTDAVWRAIAGLSENPAGDPRPFHEANIIVHILSVCEALRIRPDIPEAQRGLARLLSESGKEEAPGV